MAISICTNVLYCPGQAPMGTHSSSTKIWAWVVTQRRCLNVSTISMQGPTPDVKLDAMGPNWLALFLRPCFVKASPTVEKNVSCYRADRLVASLLNFCIVQPSLIVRKFHNAGEERCEQGHGRVCAKLWCLMSWRPKCIRTIGAMWAELTYLWIHYARI